MLNLLNVLIPCGGLEDLIKILVVLIGLVSIYLTFNIYDCKALRVVFVILGTVGLLALLLFLFAGSLQCLGLWGTIGLVVSFHALVLPEIAVQLRLLQRGRPLIKIDPGCKKRGGFRGRKPCNKAW